MGQILDQSVTQALGVPSGSFYAPTSGNPSQSASQLASSIDFSGDYEGDSLSGGDLYLDFLEIRKAGGGYSLSGGMNAQNFEEGMRGPSNTRYVWNASGVAQGQSLPFKFIGASGGGRIFIDSSGRRIIDVENTKFKLSKSG